MGKTSKKFTKAAEASKAENNQEIELEAVPPTLNDFRKSLDGLNKFCVQEIKAGNSGFSNYVLTELSYKWYDLQHKLAEKRVGMNLRVTEMEAIPFLEVRERFLNGLHNVLNADSGMPMKLRDELTGYTAYPPFVMKPKVELQSKADEQTAPAPERALEIAA